jgi:hypothetical protein
MRHPAPPLAPRPTPFPTTRAVVHVRGQAANIPTAMNDYKTCTVGEPGCEWPYRLYLLVFACVVIPLTCMEFEEQVPVQVLMSVGTCRVLRCAVLEGCCAADASCPALTRGHGHAQSGQARARSTHAPSLVLSALLSLSPPPPNLLSIPPHRTTSLACRDCPY